MAEVFLWLGSRSFSLLSDIRATYYPEMVVTCSCFGLCNGTCDPVSRVRMSPCFQVIDRFCSTFALLILSMKRHKSRRYGSSWCAGMGAALSRRSSFCLKAERGTLQARIG